MFSHVFMGVSDFDRALNFYTQVLSKLNIERRFVEPDKRWAGWHSAGGTRPYFVISKPFNGEPHDPGNGQMVAFSAINREGVQSAYQAAMALGARCEGPPGLRPHYHPHYYGAYFRDPDGNKICIACHQPEPLPALHHPAEGLRILAVSGSVRAASINAAFLRGVAQVMPDEAQVTVYQGLDALPIFNPDLDDAPPERAAQWRTLVAEADALLIASPEYAHGVTGAMKNALDWLVSHEPFVNKAVAVINTSDRAHHADDALRETLRTMNAKLVEAASITVPLLGANIPVSEMPRHKLVIDAAAKILEGLRQVLPSHLRPRAQ